MKLYLVRGPEKTLYHIQRLAHENRNTIELKQPSPGALKLFHDQLSMKFQLLLENKDSSCFQTLGCCIYHANK